MKRKENAQQLSWYIKTLDVLIVATYHHIQHPNVLKTSLGVECVTKKDIIHIHVYTDVGFVVNINLNTLILKPVL